MACVLTWMSVAPAHAQTDSPKDRPGATTPADQPKADTDPQRSPAREASRPSGGDASIRAQTEAEPASAVIREPSQGRPIFITPGDTFFFVMRLAGEFKGDVSFALRHAVEPGVHMALRPTTPPSYLNDEYCSLVLEAPAGTPPGLYDLEVSSSGTTYFSRRSVKVIDQFKTKFRFAHVSNMNVGDLTAPQFDETLPKEINLLAPEFIIATGDFTEWARARDDASSWQGVLKYFEQFNAPVFLLCGQHDHEASFSRFVAKDPIGIIDYGGYHGLLLLDHPGNPIDQDYSQLQWIETDLKRSRPKMFSFIATNSDELALLDIWREGGKLQEFLKAHKIKMFITGGSADWDFKEFADKIKGLEDFHFIRTHQASTALRDKATGVSHYRMIEVDGDKVAYTYPDDIASEKAQYSIPSGRLRTYYDSPNDGTSSRISVTVLNALNQSFKDAHVWLRVAKSGGGKPAIAPGKLVSLLDAGSHWTCEVAVDLQDKGAVNVVASADPEQIAPELPVEVALDGSTEWAFAPQTTEFGLKYFESTAQAGLRLTNRSKSQITCWPVMRVNGAQLFVDRKACPRMPVTIEPGKTVSMPIILRLRRISPGDHAFQVHFLEDPLSRLHVFNVKLSESASGALSAAENP
jgi:hypothetical protein